MHTRTHTHTQVKFDFPDPTELSSASLLQLLDAGFKCVWSHVCVRVRAPPCLAHVPCV